MECMENQMIQGNLRVGNKLMYCNLQRAMGPRDQDY